MKAGSGALTLGQPNSPGVPADFAKHTLTCTYNDLASVRAAFEQYPQDIACIIVEPVAGNMNCIPPQPEFLPGLRALCDEFGALLIIDEVMTGFRVALAGAQSYYGVEPDLTCLGKNHRRRYAGGRFRRSPRGHGRAGADGSGIPGRYAVRQPYRHGRRLRLLKRSGAAGRA